MSNLKRQTSQRYNQDQSDQDEKRIIHKKYERLGLNQQQLKERITTLKDYSTWKKTKIRRINIKKLLTEEDKTLPPIIDAVIAYGNKNKSNDVLNECIKNASAQNLDKNNGNMKLSQFQKILKSNKKMNRHSNLNPSFINYKLDAKQKQKIYKMIKPVKKEFEHTDGQQKRIQTKQKIKYSFSRQPFPKELKILKRGLEKLPTLLNRMSQNQISQLHEEQEGVSISFLKETVSSKKQTEQVKIQSSPNLIQNKINNLLTKCTIEEKDQKNFLSKSSQLMAMIKLDLTQSNCNKKAEGNLSYLSINNQRPQKYWPSYPQYHILASDQKKYAKLAKPFSDSQNLKTIQNPEITQILKMMQTQFQNQQTLMDQQLIKQQKQSINNRFKHKINLEKQNYQKNIKELLLCKKNYRLQKQREEIRANGIKRFKRINLNDKKRDKTINKEQIVDIS